ncbi:MAG TPA: caspase family protein [Vicinamibacterales bacterium]|jgi:hypothetical protein
MRRQARFRGALMLALLAVALPASQGRQREATGAGASGPERRIALVIGNDRYAGPMALQNARRDAGAVAKELRDIGFQTTLLEDAPRSRFINALETLANTLTRNDVVLFYYAGHGAQIGGENYLVPVDYAGNSEQRLSLEGVSASQIQTWLARARVSILVLDACRNNPYTGQRSTSGGLAPMEARGSLVAFAAGAGQTASDNPGGAQGTFTGALLDVLRVPGLPVREVFFRVRQRVYEASNGRQFPAVYDSLLGDVVLRPDPAAPGTVPAPSAPGPSRPAPNRTGAPPPATPPSGPGGGAGPVPAWLVGDFRGVNTVSKASMELTVQSDGTITGFVNPGTGRATPVRYEWVAATQRIRDSTGAYVFAVERTDNGFRTRQVGSPSNSVDYQRVYLPPSSGTPDARGLNRDTPRQVTPDERAAMLAVINEWKAAWERVDEAAGRNFYPSWNAAAVRQERASKGIDTVVVTLTCNNATVRRDQARVICAASMQVEYKRQLITTRGSQTSIGQKPPARAMRATWTFALFWNGSTWLIESQT